MCLRFLRPDFLQAAAQLLHPVPGFPAGFPGGKGAGKQVQRIHAEAFVREAERLVLGVDVHQEGGQFLQERQGDGLVIHEGTRAARAVHHASQEDPVLLAGEVFPAEQLPDGVADAEFGFHHARVSLRSHQGGVGLGPQDQGQGAQQDGFSCTGFTAYNDEALRE